MAKSDFRANGKLTGYFKSKRYFENTLLDIDRERKLDEKRKHKIDKGPRQLAIEVYNTKGKLAAWKVLDEMNKKLSTPIYTIETLERWISDENKQNKGQEKNDDGR